MRRAAHAKFFLVDARMSVTSVKLCSLLDRDLASEQAREHSWYDQLTAGRPDRIVLFGAGNHGRKILRGLRSLGIEPLAFADNNPALWGKRVDELMVFSPWEAAALFGTSASFVVTIFSHGAGRSFPAFRRQLGGLGCTRVVPFATLGWKYPERFLPDYSVDLPHKVIQDAEAVLAACSLWADVASRQEYLAQVGWRLSPDGVELPPPCADIPYFPADLVTARDDEFFVDCGAFDGDTIRSFLDVRSQRFARIMAFEPDPTNFERLTAWVTDLPPATRERITLQRAATGPCREKLRFAATGDMGAAISHMGEVEIDAVSLDEALAGQAPTYIKMDIEGAEPGALRGAAKLIGQHAPVLAICVYHCQNHIWRIPLQIHALCKDYTFFLRRYQEECWDVVCYAIPPGRLRRSTQDNGCAP
jgi:FkbM family methyltransferase